MCGTRPITFWLTTKRQQWSPCWSRCRNPRTTPHTHFSKAGPPPELEDELEDEGDDEDEDEDEDDDEDEAETAT